MNGNAKVIAILSILMLTYDANLCAYQKMEGPYYIHVYWKKIFIFLLSFSLDETCVCVNELGFIDPAENWLLF